MERWSYHAPLSWRCGRDGRYGTQTVNRVSVAYLLSDSLGIGVGGIAAAMAFIISLGTTNAFMAATSRLGYALARDGAFPAWIKPLNSRGVPVRAVLLVSGYALVGFALAYLFGWNADTLLFIPDSLGVATFIVVAAAAFAFLRLHRRGSRLEKLPERRTPLSELIGE